MKRIFILFLFFATTLLHAATCPSINNLKQQKLQGWQAYDAVTSKQLSKDRLQKFLQAAENFSLAEAVKVHGKSEIHCFYRDKNGSNMQTYLTKPNFGPTAELPYWYHVSGAMQCAAGRDKCFFIHKSRRAQLAMNQS